MGILKYVLIASLLISLEGVSKNDGRFYSYYPEFYYDQPMALPASQPKCLHDAENDVMDFSSPTSTNADLNAAAVADFMYWDTCENDVTQFTLLFTGPDSVLWDFDDLASGPLNNSIDTITQHIFSASGSYDIQCIIYHNNTSDTVNKTINITSLPFVFLGNDTTLCSGSPYTLTAGASPTATYLWQDGSTIPTYSATSSQAYFVTVTDNGCQSSDTISLVFKTVLIFPNTDTTICTGSKVFLDVTNSDPTFVYQWNDGYVDPYRFIDIDGIYSATVTVGNCTSTSQYVLHTLNKPTVYLGEDTILCLGGSWLLNASSPSASYLWQDGSTAPTITAVATNTFGVQVMNQCGIAADSIYLEFNECNCNIYFPKAFTPNRDNHNELYNYKYDCLEFKPTFSIFNRWGKLLFKSTDALVGWDGTFEGGDSDADAYIYVLKYTGVIEGRVQEEVKRGSFLLFR